MARRVLLGAVAVLVVPFSIHLANGAPITDALRMTYTDFQVLTTCPDRIGDFGQLLSREPLTTTDERFVNRFCSSAEPEPSPSAGGPPPTALVPVVPDSVAVVSTPTPYAPSSSRFNELRDYALQLINTDRASHGLAPVMLGDNPSAQWHADDMQLHEYIAHWDTQGRKPYMLYTLAGGQGAVAENVAMMRSSVTFFPIPVTIGSLSAREAIATLQHDMVYDDADSDWGHRDTILGQHYQFVNIGISFDSKRLSLVQHFEHRRVTFRSVPVLEGTRLTVGVTLDDSVGPLGAIAVYFDPIPFAMSAAELNSAPHSCSTGSGDPRVVILPPLPANYYYSSLDPNDLVATVWNVNGQNVMVQAELGPLASEPGVYTVVLFAEAFDYPLTNFSIVVR